MPVPLQIFRSASPVPGHRSHWIKWIYRSALLYPAVPLPAEAVRIQLSTFRIAYPFMLSLDACQGRNTCRHNAAARCFITALLLNLMSRFLLFAGSSDHIILIIDSLWTTGISASCIVPSSPGFPPLTSSKSQTQAGVLSRKLPGAAPSFLSFSDTVLQPDGCVQVFISPGNVSHHSRNRRQQKPCRRFV